MSNPFLKKPLKLPIILLCILASTSRAVSPSETQLRIGIEKSAGTLWGELPDEAELESLISKGKNDVDSMLELMIQDQRFIRHFAFYFSGQLGIKSQIPWKTFQGHKPIEGLPTRELCGFHVIIESNVWRINSESEFRMRFAQNSNHDKVWIKTTVNPDGTQTLTEVSENTQGAKQESVYNANRITKERMDCFVNAFRTEKLSKSFRRIKPKKIEGKDVYVLYLNHHDSACHASMLQAYMNEFSNVDPTWKASTNEYFRTIRAARGWTAADKQCTYQKVSNGVIRVPNGKQVPVPELTFEDLQIVEPYWIDRAKDQNIYAITKDMAKPAWCGPDLSGCMEQKYGQGGLFGDQIAEDFALEPGMMAAKIIAEDRPWSDILTTTDRVITGRMGFFFHNLMWDAIDNTYPPGSYPNRQDPIFVNADPKDARFNWVDGGEHHAGILSTPGFAKVTNGRRAKANRLLNVFMCREYQDVEGVKLEPSDEEDLTKRPYCKVCHISLEPLAAFFNRYPALGSGSNYLFDHSSQIYSTGLIDGDSGDGVQDLAKLVVKKGSFKNCGVNHLYRFMNREEPPMEFIHQHLEGYAKHLESSEMKLKPVLIKMLKDSFKF